MIHQDVKTNIASAAIKLMVKLFADEKLLHKLFNKNNLKVSYSCSGNMPKRINAHDINILYTHMHRQCNCRNKCPLGEACLIKNVVYCSGSEEKLYIGGGDGEWKSRFHNHKMSMRNAKYKNATNILIIIGRRRNRGKQTPCRV